MFPREASARWSLDEAADCRTNALQRLILSKTLIITSRLDDYKLKRGSEVHVTLALCSTLLCSSSVVQSPRGALISKPSFRLFYATFFPLSHVLKMLIYPPALACRLHGSVTSFSPPVIIPLSHNTTPT